MSEPDNDQPNARRRVEVTAADLPLHCPMPGKRLWDSHPRVYLPIGKSEHKGEHKSDKKESEKGDKKRAEERHEQTCPYCGTHYILVGEAGSSH